MVCLDRKIIASMRGCSDDSPLVGACCTNKCEQFRTCRIKREPLLVCTTNFQGDFTGNIVKIREFPEWHSGHVDMVIFQPDSEINGKFDDERSSLG